MLAVEHVVELQDPSVEHRHIILQKMVKYVKRAGRALLMEGMLIKDFMIIAQQVIHLL